jgi:hypothetical protein
MSIHSYIMTFDGEMLKRGFWLYVWIVLFNGQQYIYVGRTGNSSSVGAASPFNRVSQHLDFRKNAKGSTLARRLREIGVDPEASNFRMIALGPIFQEQESFEKHKQYRDQMARLEYEIASYLTWRGYEVIGEHQKGSSVEQSLLNEVRSNVVDFIRTNTPS